MCSNVKIGMIVLNPANTGLRYTSWTASSTFSSDDTLLSTALFWKADSLTIWPVVENGWMQGTASSVAAICFSKSLHSCSQFAAVTSKRTSIQLFISSP